MFVVSEGASRLNAIWILKAERLHARKWNDVREQTQISSRQRHEWNVCKLKWIIYVYPLALWLHIINVQTHRLKKKEWNLRKIKITGGPFLSTEMSQMNLNRTHSHTWHIWLVCMVLQYVATANIYAGSIFTVWGRKHTPKHINSQICGKSVHLKRISSPFFKPVLKQSSHAHM